MTLVKDLKVNKEHQINLEQSLQEACQDKEFVSLVQSLKLNKKEAMTKTSKLQLVLEERKHCKSCKGFYMCKNECIGHVLEPTILEEKLYFSYKPCSYQRKVLEAQNKKKVVRMKDIDTKDKKQMSIIKWMDDFYEEYDGSKYKKGLYLHGSFGSGKTYLLTALFNELERSKKATIKIAYFPELLRTLKEDFHRFGYLMDELMHVDLLLIDDIGAEKVTEWGRDEILGTILQFRMNEGKITFFTSNLTIEELEEHLSLASGVDKVKVSRIIERIKQLTIDKELISENRRD